MTIIAHPYNIAVSCTLPNGYRHIYIYRVQFYLRLAIHLHSSNSRSPSPPLHLPSPCRSRSSISSLPYLRLSPSLFSLLIAAHFSVFSSSLPLSLFLRSFSIPKNNKTLPLSFHDPDQKCCKNDKSIGLSQRH